jgi:hypothetical protein
MGRRRSVLAGSLATVLFALTVGPAVAAERTRAVPAAGVVARSSVNGLAARRVESLGEAPRDVLTTSSIAASTSYWFSYSWSSGDSRLTDYTTWTWYKINGRTNLFYVVAKGTAFTNPNPGYYLSRFEPWLTRGSSGTTLGDWDPDGQISKPDGVPVTLSLSYAGASISTTLNTSSQTYNPYINGTGSMYSVEWRGSKAPENSVGNRWISRWGGNTPWGMNFATCGKGTIVWGNCSHRP